MSFADLGLSEELLKAIADSGYDEPTPIQSAVIPSVLMGKDLIGIAQTAPARPRVSSCRCSTSCTRAGAARECRAR